MIRLKATGNDGKRYYYEFNKESSFKQVFIDFMKELGFNEETLFYFINTYQQEFGGEEILVNREITESKESIENYKNKEFDIDLIFFDKTINLIVRTKKKAKLVKVVERYFKFKEKKSRSL